MDITTEQVIYEMLTESTGTHFLDSGGAAGRHWQRNQIKTLEDFKKDEMVVFDKKYDEITLNIFPFLNECLEYEHLENQRLEKYLNKKGWVNDTESVMNYFNKALYVGYESNCINTYNGDCLLSQTLQIIYTGELIDDMDSFIAISIHNGADVRGGYTDYKIFSADIGALFNYHPESWEHIREEQEDRPQPDEEYLLVGGADSPSIANGNTWKESLIK